ELDKAARAQLTRHGVRFGRLFVFVHDLLRPAAIEARARLTRIAASGGPPLPPAGRTVLRGAAMPETAQAVGRLGFVEFDGFALRQDVAERLAAGIRSRAHAAAAFALPVELAAEAGLTRAELERVLATLGYEARMEANIKLYA